jgi:hypothetical protein
MCFGWEITLNVLNVTRYVRNILMNITEAGKSFARVVV